MTMEGIERETLVGKLKKLLALSEKGIGGEATVAKAKLEKLLAENNITLDEITDTATQEYDFLIKGRAERTLFFAIYFNVCNTPNIRYHEQKPEKGWFRLYGIELTKAQYIDIRHLFNGYREALAKEIKAAKRKLSLLPDAFIQANRIFSTYAPEEGKARTLSPQELARLREIARASRDIEPTTVRRALGSGLILNGGTEA